MTDLDYWKMSISEYTVAVTEEEARSAAKQYEDGIEILHFTDLFGSETFIPRKDFKGVWHTDFTIRQASEEFNAALKQEEKENKASWD